MKIVGVSVFSSVLVKLEYGVIGYNYTYERERCILKRNIARSVCKLCCSSCSIDSFL